MGKRIDDGGQDSASNAVDEVGDDQEPGSPAVDRRHILRLGGMAAAGAAGAAIASAVTASPAGATTGSMQFGASNDAGTDVTELTASSNTGTLLVINTGSGTPITVNSDGTAPRALYATSGGGDFIAAGDAAVVGESINSGVAGVLGSATSASGVHGVAANVSGIALGPAGVVGESSTAMGIAGASASGTGVYAASTSGDALAVNGKTTFTRSGSVSITGAAKSAVVTVVGNVTATSLVLAILQTNKAGVWVANAVPNVPAGKITITLNVAPGAGHTVKVAWFVIG